VVSVGEPETSTESDASSMSLILSLSETAPEFEVALTEETKDAWLSQRGPKVSTAAIQAREWT
jgi:hypothetical protein